MQSMTLKLQVMQGTKVYYERVDGYTAIGTWDKGYLIEGVLTSSSD